MLGAVALTTSGQTKQILQLPAQHRVQAVCVLSGEKPETYWTHADTEHVWSELCCGPFHEAAAAPSCDTVRLTVRLASFFPEQCRSGAYGSTLEKNGAGESGAADPKRGLVSFLIQGYKPAPSVGPMPMCRPYNRSD